MGKADYTYAVARIRSKELKLFSRKDIDNLIDLPSYEDAVRYLLDKGWGSGDDNASAEEILSAENDKIWSLMSELVDEENVFDVFLLQNDFHNLKVAIKGITRNLNVSGMFADYGKLPGEKIYNLVEKRQYSSLPDCLKSAAEEAMDALLRTSDGQLCDIIIDRACMQSVYSAAQSSENHIIRLYAELFVAGADIKIAVRCTKTGKTLDFIRNALAPCETLNIGALAAAAAKGTDDVCAYLSGTSYKAAVDELKKSPAAFEKYCDDLLTEKMRSQKWEPFTIGPLIAYIIARQNEIKTVRIILSGKLNDLEIDAVKERVRLMYV